MKQNYILFIVALASTLLFSACIQDEPLNSEADILQCSIPDLPKEVQYGARIITLDKGASQINIEVASNYIVGSLSPQFVLTPGATIIPESGTTLDFSDEQIQTYSITSENGKWTKTYKVAFLRFEMKPDENGNGKTRSFDFDNYQKFDGSYNFHQFYEKSVLDSKYFVWSSGNIGFAITNNSAPAEDFPTFAISEGKSGSAVKLVTRSTGALGAMVGKPIAAGNFFLGSFDVSKALSESLMATQFGVPYLMNEPLEITFYYKFQGGKYTDKNGVKQFDYPSIYAVLFEPEIDENGEVVLLNGENVFSASNIVSAARFNTLNMQNSENIEDAEFTQGSMQFEMRSGKEIDAEKLARGNYYITLVFASSMNGDTFEGFVGNTLIIDEVRLITK